MDGPAGLELACTTGARALGEREARQHARHACSRASRPPNAQAPVVQASLESALSAISVPALGKTRIDLTSINCNNNNDNDNDNFNKKINDKNVT